MKKGVKSNISAVTLSTYIGTLFHIEYTMQSAMGYGFVLLGKNEGLWADKKENDIPY